MAIIQSPIKEQIENLVNKSNNEFDKSNYITSIKLLQDAWSSIPEMKGFYSESYYIVKDIIDTCLIIKDLDTAKEWSEKLFLTDFMRFDCGEKEFIAGKVAYELGDFDIAKEFFFIANKKSEGRCFGSKDTKYLKFFTS